MSAFVDQSMPVVDEIDAIGPKPKKKRGKPELAVQSAVIAYVKRCVVGGFAFAVMNETGGSRNTRTHLFARKRQGVVSGVPDIFAFWPGGCIWLECKAPKGRLSDQQEYFHGVMRSGGQQVAVVRSIDDAEAALRLVGAPLRVRAA